MRITLSQTTIGTSSFNTNIITTKPCPPACSSCFPQQPEDNTLLDVMPTSNNLQKYRKFTKAKRCRTHAGKQNEQPAHSRDLDW
jgi:hypothetical protein